MNLVKKGTVLLAALSVFAMTSCNKGAKELSFKDALAWVKEHHGEAGTRTVKSYTKTWDYSKNDGQGKTIPDADPWKTLGQVIGEGFVGGDVNFMSKYALNKIYEISDENAKKTSGEQADCPKSTPIDDKDGKTFLKKLDQDIFSELAYKELSMRFFIENDKLKLVNSFSKSEGDQGLDMHFVETDTIYYNKEGYVEKYDLDIKSDRFYLSYKTKINEEEKLYTQELGVVDMHTSIIPVV